TAPTTTSKSAELFRAKQEMNERSKTMKDQAATALQPLREIASLKPVTDDFSHRSKEIYDSIARRAFEIIESSGRVSGRDHEDWLQAEAELLHPIHLDIAESDEAV